MQLLVELDNQRHYYISLVHNWGKLSIGQGQFGKLSQSISSYLGHFGTSSVGQPSNKPTSWLALGPKASRIVTAIMGKVEHILTENFSLDSLFTSQTRVRVCLLGLSKLDRLIAKYFHFLVAGTASAKRLGLGPIQCAQITTFAISQARHGNLNHLGQV